MRPARSSARGSALSPLILAGKRVEGGVGIDELRGRDRSAGANQRLHVLVDVPHVDVHPGDDALVRQPEGDELTAGRVAAEDDLVPFGREARVLHADVVLVGVEVRVRS